MTAQDVQKVEYEMCRNFVLASWSNEYIPV